MGIMAGYHGCHREGVPPALTAELRPRGWAPVPLAWLCAACAADPATRRRFEGALRGAFVETPAPLRIAPVADWGDPAARPPSAWGADLQHGEH